MTVPPPRATPRRIHLLLGLVLLAGLVLRTWNLNFDGGLMAHPDERSTACWPASWIRWPDSWETFRDPRRSPLNPLWDPREQREFHYTYGHFPLYLGVATGELLHRLAPQASAWGLPDPWVERMAQANTPCAGVALAGRLVIALLDTLTILLVYLLGRRLYGPWPGVLAAALYAFTAQAIQLSHFWAMDPASTTFTVLAVLGGVQMVQERSWRAVLLAGGAAGLAISSKFSALPVLAVPVVAGLAVLWREQRGRLGDGPGAARMVLGIPVALAVAGMAFAVTSPYAVLDWRHFLQYTLVEQGQMVRGIADFPFTRQYRNTTPYLYFIEQQVRWGMGWPLGVVALAGTLWALGRLLLGRARAEELVVWSWVLPYFGLTGAFLAKFNRYMSPVLPFMVLFAAGLVAWLWRPGKEAREAEPGAQGAEVVDLPGARSPRLASPDLRSSGRPRFSRLLAGLLAAIALTGAVFWSLAYVNGVYGREHTWIQASRWVYANVPSGSVILWELWDDPLPKAIPGEPGMDMGSRGLRHIDWSPYEEDTPEKYQILKERLREADYVIYASKRIYDSVDELPERYPMTIRYYQLMFQEELGFEKAAEFTSPPRLFGWEFPDHTADESWSLYDHPQVTIFRKVRDLSDAEFDALLGGTWEGAQPYYRGKDSPLSPLLNLLGLGSSPESQDRGLINRVLALLLDEGGRPPKPPEKRKDLSLGTPLRDLPVVDNYRWNVRASQSPWLAVAWWWLVLSLLGWLSWPLAFLVFRRLRDRGYFLARTLGWLLAGWVLWILASFGLAHNTVVNAWLTVAFLALLAAAALAWSWHEYRPFLRRMGPALLVGEILFAGAYLAFVLVRMANPDLWQPWFGGEKFMEFAFLNGILRSPTFPPVDPHFAGGYINYYYFGIYLVAYLVKLTGIYAEVAFNLAVPTLFALTVLNAFGVAYSAVRSEGRSRRRRPADVLEIDLGELLPRSRDRGSPGPSSASSPSWRQGLLWSLLAPLFVAVLGNLDAFAQVVRQVMALSDTEFVSGLPGVTGLVRILDGLWTLLTTEASLPGYDFWAPSRVIDYTINEFPYWSFTFADLHPHMIGIPFAVLFLGLVLAAMRGYRVDWRVHWGEGMVLLLAFGLLLGTLASVNLWELPTYYGLGVLAVAVMLWRGRGVRDRRSDGDTGEADGRAPLPGRDAGPRVPDWLLGLGFAVLYPLLAYLTFYPFFRDYANVGASGVGWVRSGDPLGRWLLIWGFFVFVLATWLWITGARPARPGDARPTGLERWLSLALGKFDRLPRLIALQRILVHRATPAFTLGTWLLPLSLVLAGLIGLLTDRTILALSLPFLALAFLLLWRRGRAADPGDLFTGLLVFVGGAILAGTQVVYLKDFLQGGDWYRMNTLFKFFIQVWVLWGVAAAVAVPRILAGTPRAPQEVRGTVAGGSPGSWRMAWTGALALLLVAGLAYPVWGTPARSDQRFPGWRPDFGTLNGLDFMRQGVYYWPDNTNPIELRYDWEAIQWILANVRGNLVLVESATTEYYRAGGTRVASLTGLSSPVGMHAGEQRYGEDVGRRSAWLNEFWSTPDVERTLELIRELDVSLIYVGQLERHQHPDGVAKLERMAGQGLLQPIYTNPRVTIYAVPGTLIRGPDGRIYPRPNPEPGP